MTILDEIERLTDADAEVRTNAYVELFLHLDSLRTLGAVEKAQFERLGRQVASYPDWPESEQRRFRHLALGVRHALVKAGVTGEDGYPLR